MSIVQVDTLTKRYPAPGNSGAQVTVVDGITFAIEKGEIFGILGPNGAGKTTTLEIIEGLTDADGGTVHVDGIDVSNDPIAVKQRIGVQLQESEYFDHLNLGELLSMFGAMYQRTISPDELLKLVHLEEKRAAFTKHLSGGQKQRFSVALALVNDPEVLFLDEPTTGLDPQARHKLWDLIRDIHARGKTIVLTTHYMDEAEELCDRIAIMEAGKIIALDTPTNLITAHAPEPPTVPKTGSLEDVFLSLTGKELRE